MTAAVLTALWFPLQKRGFVCRQPSTWGHAERQEWKLCLSDLRLFAARVRRQTHCLSTASISRGAAARPVSTRATTWSNRAARRTSWIRGQDQWCSMGSGTSHAVATNALGNSLHPVEVPLGQSCAEFCTPWNLSPLRQSSPVTRSKPKPRAFFNRPLGPATPSPPEPSGSRTAEKSRLSARNLQRSGLACRRGLRLLGTWGAHRFSALDNTVSDNCRTQCNGPISMPRHERIGPPKGVGYQALKNSSSFSATEIFWARTSRREGQIDGHHVLCGIDVAVHELLGS